MTKPSDVLSADDKSDVATLFEHAAKEALDARGKAPLRAGPGRVRLLRTESGRVVTHGEVVRGLFKKLDIEVQVVDGKRPVATKCNCGAVLLISPIGGMRRFCDTCRVRRTKKPCITAGCANMASKLQSTLGRCESCARTFLQKRGGDPQRCLTGREFGDWIVGAHVPAPRKLKQGSLWSISCKFCGFSREARGALLTNKKLTTCPNYQRHQAVTDRMAALSKDILASKLTQRELRDKSGISKSTLSKITNGHGTVSEQVEAKIRAALPRPVEANEIGG